MNLLIGSKALLFHNDELLNPSVKRTWDTDWICSYPAFENFVKKTSPEKVIQTGNNKFATFKEKSDQENVKSIHEFEIATKDSTAAELLQIIKEDPSLYTLNNNVRIASPDLVFTLKKSHRYLKNSPYFLKTMMDYNHLAKNGCKVPASLESWYKKREKETYSYKHPNLNVKKNDFFKDDKVPYVYDHDTIHLAVAHKERPAYEYYKADKAEVNCSKELFFNCPEEIRLYGVLEEAYVLALERSQIPAPGVITPRKSFEIALMKVCTSITSGWFRAYAYENYFKVLEMFDEKYVDRFWEAEKKGIVKKLDGQAAVGMY